MKKLRSFKVAKAKAMKKPVCLLKVLAGGDVELRFNNWREFLIKKIYSKCEYKTRIVCPSLYAY